MTKSIEKHGMKVEWHYYKDKIIITMLAPSKGWVAVGFKENIRLENTYLLMGSIVNKQVDAMEHFIDSAGSYKNFETLKINSSIQNISGTECNNQTTIKFPISFSSENKLQKDLREGNSIDLLMAYSRGDDFRHYSMWRESYKIQL
jgi:hypothetical protein